MKLGIRGFMVRTVVPLLIVASAASAPSASAATGYELSPSIPMLTVDGELPHGIAVDQTSRDIYVAVPTTNSGSGAPGHIVQLDSSGNQTPASPFRTGAADLFTGVAVNPTTQNVYAVQAEVTTGFGNFGEWRMDVFTPSGTPTTTIGLSTSNTTAPQIAADSSGNVYFPNDAGDSIQVFSSAGTLQTEITCSDCGGGFVQPLSVAIDSADNVYVVDGGTDKVIKLQPSSASYAFGSVLQSNRGAVAVGVDPSTDDVFIGDLDLGGRYHVVAYDSSGTQFDDFGGGMLASVSSPRRAGQIAADATNQRLYVADAGANVVRVFDRVTISAPTVETESAAAIGQLTATLSATVNANKHAVIECVFEYTDQADFAENGFANAAAVPCTTMPFGSVDTAVHADISGLSPETTYHYRAVAANNGGLTEGAAQMLTTLPVVPPTVSTDPAVGVTATTATLVGTVNPHGGTVMDCHFDYGTTIAYGVSTPCDTPTGPGTADISQNLPLAGLSAETTYHFRFVVTTNAGTAEGGDAAFTTFVPPPPTVTTEPATQVTESSATIGGRITPNGSAASCYLEYGETTAYGTEVPCPGDPGAGDRPVLQIVDLTGLATTTTYHYRMVGTNSGGTETGADVSFATLSVPEITSVAEAPTENAAPPPSEVIAPVRRPLRCRNGLRKKRVGGKVRCVCRRGFRKKRVGGKARCVCRRGFRKKRVGGKVRCVKLKRKRMRGRR